MNRILLIRGGAIGDFVLTLPALKALRDANAGGQIEILGYKHIAELAHNRFYANQVRSIEYAPLSRFFAKDSELTSELGEYFSTFDLIITYLYDPDKIFENNLGSCGVRKIVRGPPKVDTGAGSGHAARQLAEPIEKLGVKVNDLGARLYPSAEDREFARDFLRDCTPPIVALHPGSGSEKKNWPLNNWIEVGNYLLDAHSSSRSGGFQAADGCSRRSGERRSLCGSLVVVSGEADEHQVAQLESIWKNRRVRFAKNLPLPHLAAVLEHSIFVGHDSGISHLAAAAGANCILLFGPTDPNVWAPRNENVQVLRAPTTEITDIKPEEVREALISLLSCRAKSRHLSNPLGT
jgi:heptosyltransferase-3